MMLNYLLETGKNNIHILKFHIISAVALCSFNWKFHSKEWTRGS